MKYNTIHWGFTGSRDQHFLLLGGPRTEPRGGGDFHGPGHTKVSREAPWEVTKARGQEGSVTPVIVSLHISPLTKDGVLAAVK